MPQLVDTTIRLLSQEPLARPGRPRPGLYELAGELDKAGFACLEVSGGGCFDAAVRRGVESPWERIRAIRARCSTPLGMALRGRFLVGSRPVSGDLVRRFVASAAGSGIDVFRLHDPLNDLANLREAADAIRSAGKELVRRARAQPGPDGRDRGAARAGAPPRRARRGARPDPRSGQLARPGQGARARRARRRGERASCRAPLPGRGRRRRSRPRSRRSAPAQTRIACALYPVALSLHRVSAEALTQSLAGLELDTGVDARPALARLGARGRGARRRAGSAALAAGRRARRGAQPSGRPRRGARRAPARARLRRPARRGARGAARDPRASAAGRRWPSPIGQVLGSQALLHVLSAQRWRFVVDELRDLVEGRYGTPPGEIDPTVKRARRAARRRGRAGRGAARRRSTSSARTPRGLASSEEELLLLALFGDDAEPLLRSIRARGGGDDRTRPGSRRARRSGCARSSGSSRSPGSAR